MGRNTGKPRKADKQAGAKYRKAGKAGKRFSELMKRHNRQAKQQRNQPTDTE